MADDAAAEKAEFVADAAEGSAAAAAAADAAAGAAVAVEAAPAGSSEWPEPQLRAAGLDGDVAAGALERSEDKVAMLPPPPPLLPCRE